MDVEYQKKEVTWCLDRIGPKICLKAIAINDKLQQLEITSEQFRLEFENEEAREFLEILRNITTVKPTSIPVPEAAPSHSIQVGEFKSEIRTIPRTKEETSPPIPTLDTSEILEMLKQSESSVGEERISFRRKFAENEALEKKTHIRPQPQQEADESVLGISIEENVRASEIFTDNLDTASFFRGVEEKSPLEQLLEEKEGLGKLSTSESPLDDTGSSNNLEKDLESEAKIPLSPDDLNSSSFMSNFSTKPVDQDLGAIKSKALEHAAESDLDQQIEDSGQERAFLSEDERKKEIERERAARKKRLWELTRGF